MSELNVATDLLFLQYKAVRDEAQRSVFIQYEVIKVGTTFLSSLFVAVLTSFAAFGFTSLPILSFILIAIAYIAMSFVFIMGAGEIRIMRAAGFNTKILECLLRTYQPNSKSKLIWDKYVLSYQQALYGRRNGWKFHERIYLAMPFIVIATLADVGGISSLVYWLQGRTFLLVEALLILFAGLSLAFQIWLYLLPSKVSRNLPDVSADVNEECSKSMEWVPTTLQ